MSLLVRRKFIVSYLQIAASIQYCQVVNIAVVSLNKENHCFYYIIITASTTAVEDVYNEIVEKKRNNFPSFKIFHNKR